MPGHLNQLRQAYQQYAAAQAYTTEADGLFDPVSYILSLTGKQLRPILVLLAAEIFSDETDQALPAAHAVELFHNFSLMHDDIMDNAPLRRGKATVHEKWNLNTAILSGDAMLVLSYQYLAQTGHPELPKLFELFSRTAMGVCEGQQLDMNFEQESNVSLERYIHMIQLKTAVLLAAALEIGAIIGGAGLRDAEYLYEFGLKLGTSFQLHDDYLDTYGDPEKFGKKVGGDIAQNKKTYLYIKALENASPALKAELLQWYGSTDNESAKIARVSSIFKETGADQALLQHADLLYQEALAALDAVQVDPSRKAHIKQFASWLMSRDV
jgi:geranylgeranyl diphosphate synthase type II